MSVYVDIRVIALDEEVLKEIMIALRKMEWCGSVGAGRTLPIYIDGDGAGRLNFQVIKKEGTTNISDIVKLDEDKIKKVRSGDDFETHYIGA
jgi:hypothetical protein